MFCTFQFKDLAVFIVSHGWAGLLLWKFPTIIYSEGTVLLTCIVVHTRVTNNMDNFIIYLKLFERQGMLSGLCPKMLYIHFEEIYELCLSVFQESRGIALWMCYCCPKLIKSHWKFQVQMEMQCPFFVNCLSKFKGNLSHISQIQIFYTCIYRTIL